MPWFGRRMRGAAPVAEPAADPPPEPAAAPGWFPRGAVVLTALGGATLTAFGLWAIQSFFAPFVLALVLTICVHPVRVRLEGAGVPRGAATGSVIAVVFLLLAGFIGAFAVALGQFAGLLPQFAPQIRALGETVSSALTTLGFEPSQAQEIVKGIDPGRVVGFFAGLLGNVTNLVFALVVVLSTLILMAVDAGTFPTVLRQLRPTRPGMVAAVTVFATGVRRYMVATTALGVAQGVLNWVSLLLLQVPGALLWGLLSFLCSFIPNIGYFIAIVPPLVFGYFVGGWQTVVAVILVYAVINGVVQSLVQPRVVGNAVALSQTLTLLSTLFWATVLGPVGAILGIPLTLLVRALLVDGNPDTLWWRPVIGDLTTTKKLMRDEDAAAKSARARRKAAGR